MILALTTALAAAACGSRLEGSATSSSDTATRRRAAEGIELLEPRVVRRIRHDTGAFTQGLLRRGSLLWESTGLYGRSELRAIDPNSGRVVASARLPARLFGEGLAAVGDDLVQLTWREREALVWDPDSLSVVDRHHYDGEGWGLTSCGRDLWMSDGSSRLTRRDPRTFVPTGALEVEVGGSPLASLNELECVGEVIWANVWPTTQIVGIDSETGSVRFSVDAAALSAPFRHGENVLNGIAHVPERDTFLLTGKRWPWIFEVQLVPVGRDPGTPRSSPQAERD